MLHSVSTNVKKLAIEFGNPARCVLYGYFLVNCAMLRLDFDFLERVIYTVKATAALKSCRNVSHSVSTNVKKLAIEIGNPASFGVFGYFLVNCTRF